MKTVIFLLLVISQVKALAVEPADRVGFDQRIGALLPLETIFTDSTGRSVRLGNLFSVRPVVFVMSYARCPNLCGIVRDGFLNSIREIVTSVGSGYDVIVVSIDPQESPAIAAEKKASYIHRYARLGTEKGWHVLVGTPEAIKQLTSAIGFRYFYDKASGEFAHPSGIVIVTPQGRISQYFLGIEYPPRELLGAIEKASRDERGSFAQNLLLLCFHYNPETGKYSLAIIKLLRISGMLMVGALILGICLLHRRHPRSS